MGALEYVGLLTNRVIDVLRRSLRRQFPVVFGVSTYGPEKGLRITEGLGLVAVT